MTTYIPLAAALHGALVFINYAQNRAASTTPCYFSLYKMSKYLGTATRLK